MSAAPKHTPQPAEDPSTLDPQDIEFIGHSGEFPTMSSAPVAEESEPFVAADQDVLISKIRIEEKREGARGTLAIIFTIATFLLFVLGFAIAAISDGNKVDNLKEVLLTVSGIFSGLLGFVIGYYFRTGEENR